MEEGKLFLIWVILLLGHLNGYKSCIEKERGALLELKRYIVSQVSKPTVRNDVLPTLTTWANDTKSDCCHWKGVACNRTSRRVIELSINTNIEGYHIPYGDSYPLNLSLLHPFEELRTMNLSWGQHYGQFNGFFDDVEGYQSLRRLRNLEILDLSFNNFNYSIFPFLNAATSLTTLFLRWNFMEGPFPMKELKNLTNLELLDLSDNAFYGSMPELKDMKSLELLNLGGNGFSGSMPVVCEMKNLQELDLSQNNFVGQIPLCLGSLKKLRVLDLSSNKISGNLPSSFSGLESLEYLSLLDNNITGLFSLSPLTNLTKLKVFKLVPTSGMVQVDIRTAWQPKFQLSVLVLRFCGLEKIPSFLSYQKRLRLVDLSNNKLSGGTPTWLLVNNPELQGLFFQNNSFSIFLLPTIVTNNLKFLDFSANNIGGLLPDNIGRALPNLVHMNGSNNEFQGHFPSSMGEMKYISFLDLSYNNLSGKLPTSFFMGCSSLNSLKLSHNRFSGHFLPEITSFTSLQKLAIDNNLFSGEIGVGLLSSRTTLDTLDMSNNCLTGTIPSWITELYKLDYLLLSNNFLRGTVPPPLLDIYYLDLSGNRFSGALPSRINNSGVAVKKLFLHNNNFTGSIPGTLLDGVMILDLRNNKLSGSIPQFVNLTSTRILLVKGNNLSGSIPKQLCDLSNVRFLDLSDNKLSGFIPSCLHKLSSGLGREGEFSDLIYSGYLMSAAVGIEVFGWEIYRSTFVVEKIMIPRTVFHEFEIKFTVKQRYESYIGGSLFSKGVLDYMYGLDLSKNALSGVIPAELGNLLKLRSMNLSHNLLSSSIPSSFSNLKDIESLDLSYNKLQGSIPHQLTSLVSLSAFNVSYNNLSGIIPRGRQFNTFDESRYLGNPLLCGPPTNRSCDATKSSEEEDNGSEEEDEVVVDMLVFYYSAGSTYLTVLIGIVVLMCIDCLWRRAWLRIVDAFITSAKICCLKIFSA